MSSHRDDLESTIRRCVREEIGTFGGGAQSLLNRTRHLILEASTSVAREIETNVSTPVWRETKSAWPSFSTSVCVK